MPLKQDKKPCHTPNSQKKNRHGIHSKYNIKASIAFLGFLFCGCMRVYKPVYIPVKCNIPKLERPPLSSPSLSANVQALMIYTELLEQDLNFCRNGAAPQTQTKESYGK
ncbi:hypothetical protein NHP190012_11590 [Helicobacter sp. NHP19-012]|uniref:Lipoprotein n=1 Tax=Helicobacter gastrofelis TaxID=2849642 RepID=A0ABN6I7F6_9HELI|nr:hypothetical protein NHP190012_11590 [Helicobacter sp. NHP19-012]